MIFNNLTWRGRVAIIRDMRKYIQILSVFFGLVAMAMPANAYVDRATAVVRIMNKAAGKVQTLALPVGQTVAFEKLNLTARACKQTDPFDAENFFMFIDIDKGGEGRIFANWMDRNEPGDRPLQDADYDVWLVRCE